MSKLREILGRWLTTWRQNMDIRRAFMHDCRRYLHYSIPVTSGALGQQAARMMAVAHSLEKGLSLAEVRPGFGMKKAEKLAELLQSYEQEHPKGLKHSGYLLSRGILCHYVAFQKSCGVVLPESVAVFGGDDDAPGGVMLLSRQELLRGVHGDFPELAASRVSIRNFSDVPVDMALIRQAVELAQRTPSSCNRQSGRVCVVTDPQKIEAVCSLLTGFKGFGKHIDKFILVSGDVCAFSEARERHQAWTEGGMFAMSLLYALTYYGIGSCVLNWSVIPSRDMKLRKLLQLDPSWENLLFIALGNLREENRVSCSVRRPIEEIMIVR